MLKLYGQHRTVSLSELEMENITNYLVRESIEIITEEIEYFYLTREKSFHPVLDEVSLTSLDLKALRHKLNSVLYTKEEIRLLVGKIENRIRKEIRIANWDCDFKFDLTKLSWIEPGNIVVLLQEEIKTMFYSKTMTKVIDRAWFKMKKDLIPSGLSKLSAKLKIGDIVLTAVQVDPQKIEGDLKKKIARLVRGSIKQYESQLCRELSEQVCQQIFVYDMPYPDNVEMLKVQTV